MVLNQGLRRLPDVESLVGSMTLGKPVRYTLRPIPSHGYWAPPVAASPSPRAPYRGQAHPALYCEVAQSRHHRKWTRSTGSNRSGDAVRKRISPGASSRQSRCYTRCLFTASTPKPEGGAPCVSSARRDLCGGRGAILVPTATVGRPSLLRCDKATSGELVSPATMPCPEPRATE